MSTYTGYSMDRGLIARPDYTTLTYVYPVQITVLGLEGLDQKDICCLKRLVELVTVLENQNYHDGLYQVSLTILAVSITPSTFIQRYHQVNLLMLANIRLSEAFLLSDQIQARHAILVLANRIDIAASTVTLSRTHVLTSCALNMFSDGQWLEPPQHSIYRRQTKKIFTSNWETHTDGDINRITLAQAPTLE